MSISTCALREEGDSSTPLSVPTTFYFYPRPPRGGRPAAEAAAGQVKPISIHALREEGDPGLLQHGRQVWLISIHALREEGDTIATAHRQGRYKFLSTPSARKATSQSYPQKTALNISIHALREEGDADQEAMKLLQTKFLSTPSARRATRFRAAVGSCFPISIHASARRATCPLEPACADTCISIHALREEGDRNRCFRADRSADFYPRPPRGGRPVRFLLLHVQQDFYPRPPRGGRPRAAIGGDKQKEISIHALREEGDECREHAGRNQCISIHALREEGDVFFLTKISPIF